MSNRGNCTSGSIHLSMYPPGGGYEQGYRDPPPDPILPPGRKESSWWKNLSPDPHHPPGLGTALAPKSHHRVTESGLACWTLSSVPPVSWPSVLFKHWPETRSICCLLDRYSIFKVIMCPILAGTSTAALGHYSHVLKWGHVWPKCPLNQKVVKSKKKLNPLRWFSWWFGTTLSTLVNKFLVFVCVYL